MRRPDITTLGTSPPTHAATAICYVASGVFPSDLQTCFRRRGQPLVGTGRKRGKFPHLSEELKTSDNVLDLARIGGDGCAGVGQTPGRLLHPSCLKLRPDKTKRLEVMAAVGARHESPQTTDRVSVCD